jgi:putative phosphoesterase
MKIGVISDTHGNMDAVRLAFATWGEVDLIVHAGDVLYHPPRLGFTEGYNIPGTAELFNSLTIPLVISQGNCDAQVYEELLNAPVSAPYAYAQIGGIGLLASHGHLMHKSELIKLASRFGAKYAITGHTHVPELKIVDGIVYMNPGSPSLPKYELNGILVPSVGIITDNGTSIISVPDGVVLMELHSN